MIRRVLAALLLALLAGAARAAPLPIRIAWIAVPAELTPVLFQQRDLLDHNGKTYTVEHIRFSPNATIMRALAAGEIDLAWFTPIEFGLAIQNAGLDDLRVVADGYQDGAPRRYSTEFLVREDSAIRVIDDLAGKALAVEALGGMNDFGLRAMMRRHGFEERRDYALLEAPLANLGALLEGRKTDLAALSAPFSYVVKARGTARPLFTLRDAIGPSQGPMLVARADFLDRNEAALDDFFEDYLRALRWFLDPVHRAEAAGLVAAFARGLNATFADYLFTEDDYARDPGGRPNIDALQKTLDALRKGGFLDIAIDASHYVDASFIDAAARRLH